VKKRGRTANTFTNLCASGVASLGHATSRIGKRPHAGQSVNNCNYVQSLSAVIVARPCPPVRAPYSPLGSLFGRHFLLRCPCVCLLLIFIFHFVVRFRCLFVCSVFLFFSFFFAVCVWLCFRLGFCYCRCFV